MTMICRQRSNRMNWVIPLLLFLLFDTIAFSDEPLSHLRSLQSDSKGANGPGRFQRELKPKKSARPASLPMAPATANVNPITNTNTNQQVSVVTDPGITAVVAPPPVINKPLAICENPGYEYKVQGSTISKSGAMSSGTCASNFVPLQIACLLPNESHIQGNYTSYLECMHKEGYLVHNWFFNREAIGTFQFVPAPQRQWEGSFKGSISNEAVTNSSFEVERVAMEYVNPELKDQPVKYLTNITFDYFIEQCPSCSNCESKSRGKIPCANTHAQCLQQLSVSIFTFKPTVADDDDKARCVNDFVLGTNGVAQGAAFEIPGEWHTVSFNPLTTLSLPSRNKCPDRLGDDTNLLLGIKRNFGIRKECVGVPSRSIALNIGTESCQDSGLIAYFDNIRFHFSYANGTLFHKYNMTHALP